MKTNDAAEVLREWIDFQADSAGKPDEIFNALESVLDELDRLRKANEPQWVKINSEEDLPKERGRYLVKTSGRLSICRNYLPEAPAVVREWLDDFIAWMPIPKYQEDEDV